MATEIPHITAQLDTIVPGNPGWATVIGIDGSKQKPLIRCNCGRWMGIALHHVHADGTVTASFYHKRGTNQTVGEDPNGCEWHVWLKLLDYNLGEFPPEK